MEKDKSNKLLIIISSLQLIIILVTVFLQLNSLEKDKGLTYVILAVIVMPIVTSVTIYLLGQFISPKPKKIEECKETLDDIVKTFKWNTTQPLKILTTAFVAQHIPYDDLEKFADVQVVIDMSKKTIDARTTAVPLRKNNYLTMAWDGAKSVLRHIETKKNHFKKIRIVAADLNQYPVGVMICNDPYIFYAPLWNHQISAHDVFKGCCLKIDSNSQFGKELLKSFDNLFNSEMEISNSDIDFLQEYYRYTDDELKK